MSLASLHLLILVIAANSTPVLLARILGDRFNQPIDRDIMFIDGRPLLGSSKTWRGFVGAVIVCALLAPLLDYSVMIGASCGALAMFGDLLSSFSKRRLGMQSSSKAPFIDQVPESLLPALVLKSTLALSWLDIALLTIAFTVLEVVFSVVLFRLGIRKHPY